MKEQKKERIRAAEINWKELDSAQAALQQAIDAHAKAHRALSARIAQASAKRDDKILALAREGVPIYTIAAHLGISRSAIYSARSRRRRNDGAK